MNRFKNNPTLLLLLLIMGYQVIRGGQSQSISAWIMDTLMILPGIVIGLSFHEYAHAQVATLCGDPTPRQQGRVTLNPFAHFDPVGLIALLFIRFGWGKPVMIQPRYFKKPRRDEFLVAISGVTMNLILATLFMGGIRLLYQLTPDFFMTSMGAIVQEILIQVVVINLVLMVFNLLPIPPLDGFNVLTQIFNLRNTDFYYKVYDKGFLILMLLIILNVTGRILQPSVSFLFNTLFNLFF
ncbi:MAG: site-2 protease family protein [Firmicutes bacterium HGW-Firmicutes-11]|jgi:Zn-dependent protease|nr:MAG: site-2 protease family protein [Firmicutes bacterium HGW-Firmicutes-11]